MATILVVDDSPVSRHLLAFMLRREGHTVITLACGLQALDLLAAETIDLVVADLAMPGMDGLALLDAMRSQERLRGVQIIMLTASGQTDDRQRAEAAGANSFLTKPASSRDLIATVDRLLHSTVS